MYGLGEFDHDPTDTKQYYKEKLKEQTEKIRVAEEWIESEKELYKKVIREEKQWPPDEMWFNGYVYGMETIVKKLKEEVK